MQNKIQEYVLHVEIEMKGDNEKENINLLREDIQQILTTNSNYQI